MPRMFRSRAILDWDAIVSGGRRFVDGKAIVVGVRGGTEGGACGTGRYRDAETAESYRVIALGMKVAAGSATLHRRGIDVEAVEWGKKCSLMQGVLGMCGGSLAWQVAKSSADEQSANRESGRHCIGM